MMFRVWRCMSAGMCALFVSGHPHGEIPQTRGDDVNAWISKKYPVLTMIV